MSCETRMVIPATEIRVGDDFIAPKTELGRPIIAVHVGERVVRCLCTGRVRVGAERGRRGRGGASGMNRAVTLPLVARTAYQNSRCSLCDIIIIGYHGARPYLEILDRMLRVEVEPAHPIDTLDEIVRVDGAWVHADCAETVGHEVRR